MEQSAAIVLHLCRKHKENGLSLGLENSSTCLLFTNVTELGNGVLVSGERFF
jgi:hypothetical protein